MDDFMRRLAFNPAQGQSMTLPNDAQKETT
jgi:hypothetical protein